MITERDLQDAIAECQGERNPNASTCIKLAAYFTIYDHLYPKESKAVEQDATNIFKTVDETVISNYGDTEFYRLISGRKSADIWPIMNELMETIQIVNPKLYDGVIRQLL